ncbi:hypothetical protein F5887DRAFT_516480 [Amanita rubescens]|nr:hypothetical protein F5887DRAFT_516480 [Amanita rubescens]
MVKPLPAGCRLTTVFETCHSGTALDLPYIYNSTDSGEQNPQQSYHQLLVSIRDILRRNEYSQIPQLSYSHPMDMNLPFIC